MPLEALIQADERRKMQKGHFESSFEAASAQAGEGPDSRFD